MKTLILSFVLIFGLSGLNHGKPINDIYSIKTPIFTDEAYINDIPFNTWEIAVDAILDGHELDLEEESNVNDIPFDTRAIACKYLLQKMIEKTGEANINDIPFNTEKILYEQMAAQLTEQYRNEENIHDMQALPNYIICSYKNGVSSCVAVKVNMPEKTCVRQKRIEESDYTIIYPVKLEFPKVEVKNDVTNEELLVVPSFSL